MAKRQKTTAFSFQGYDLDHYRTTDAYTRAIGNLFDRATSDIAAGVAKLNVDPDKPFQFSDYPSAQATLKRVVNKLAKNMTAVVSEGSRKQWLYACHKNDEFISSIIDTSKLTRARLQKMQDRNLDALQTFQQRKVEGMNLSQRVWKYVGQFKDQIEQGLDVGLGDGRSAQQLSQDLKDNLKDPNRLYRRVRDKRGNLQLSKNAKAFHPGQGVYRSSHKNAMRLTRSEINMAYRESDWLRWQQLDFVIGFEVHRSNHEPRCKCDLCDKLVGRYPKTFKFKGWHPQCMCYATAILMDEADYDAQELSDLKSALRGTEYKKLEVKNAVTDVPQGFKDWVVDNQEAQAGWGSIPYFIKDNFKDGLLSKGLKPNIVQGETKVEHVNLADMPEEEVQMWRNKWLDIEREYNAIKNDLYTYKINDDTLFDMIGDALYETRNKSAYWRIDEAKEELARLKNELAEAKMNRFNNLIKPYNDVIDKIRIDSREWGLNTFLIDDAIAKQDATSMIRGIKEMQSRIATVDAEYKAFINNAIQTISDARKAKIDYSSVQDALTTVKSDKREWIMGKTSFKKALEELQNKIVSPTQLKGVIQLMDNAKVDYNNVTTLPKPLSENEIIDRVGGGDLTKGSCSSLAFTYAGNRCGFDVLDFRDGESRRKFATTSNIMEIADKVGGIVREDLNDFSNANALLNQMVEDKEYYFTCGAHAAIIRKTKSGYEYLELQSATKNGFHPLTANELKWRFGAKKSHTLYGTKYKVKECLIDIDLLQKESGFQKMLGYINTKESNQRKGTRGSVK